MVSKNTEKYITVALFIIGMIIGALACAVYNASLTRHQAEIEEEGGQGGGTELIEPAELPEPYNYGYVDNEGNEGAATYCYHQNGIAYCDGFNARFPVAEYWLLVERLEGNYEDDGATVPDAGITENNCE